MTALFNEPMENARAHIISIFQKERRIEGDDGNLHKQPTEYEDLIRELWDYCDTQKVEDVESTTVEFDAEEIKLSNKLMDEYGIDGENNLSRDLTVEEAKDAKVLITERAHIRSYASQLEDYLVCRLEQGEMQE